MDMTRFNMARDMIDQVTWDLSDSSFDRNKLQEKLARALELLTTFAQEECSPEGG